MLSQRFFNLTPLRATRDVEGFLDRIRQMRKGTTSTTWFRGHSSARLHLLIPSAGRPHCYNGKSVTFSPRQEHFLLHRFRRRAYPLVGRVLNEWDALFLGRHHSLPTRLLDWTRNALAGLYFASVHHQDEDGDVWAIVRHDDTQYDLDVLRLSQSRRGRDGPLQIYGSPRRERANAKQTLDAVKIIHPFYNSPRIVSQDGAFTLHSRPARPLDTYAGLRFLEARLDIAHLFRIPVLARGKRRIISELDSLGVNRRTLFPDLDGISQGLWETEVLWRG